MLTAEPLRWKPPSAIPTFRGLPVALPHCGVRAAKPNGKKWPDCCGFVVLPESQSQWLILRRGSIDVVPAAIRLKATDQTWHYEQWPHLKFAGSTRRPRCIPYGLHVAPESCALHQEVSDWCCSPWVIRWVLGSPVLHHGTIRPDLGCWTPEAVVLHDEEDTPRRTHVFLSARVPLDV